MTNEYHNLKSKDQKMTTQRKKSPKNYVVSEGKVVRKHSWRHV